MSRQDSLPQIVPSARGSADLGNIRSKGNTLGPGLDFAFREGPTNVGPVAASSATSGARKVVSTGGDCPPGAVGSVDRVSGDIYLSRLDNQTPDEVGTGSTLETCDTHPRVRRYFFRREFCNSKKDKSLNLHPVGFARRICAGVLGDISGTGGHPGNTRRRTRRRFIERAKSRGGHMATRGYGCQIFDGGYKVRSIVFHRKIVSRREPLDIPLSKSN